MLGLRAVNYYGNIRVKLYLIGYIYFLFQDFCLLFRIDRSLLYMISFDFMPHLMIRLVFYHDIALQKNKKWACPKLSHAQAK